MISIVIPVFNAEKYLAECLDSVINQDYKNIEVLLVNDGSTDKSGEICWEYAAKDNRIKVFEQNNSGVAVSRNLGLSKATGKYIFFLDADDYLEPHFFAVMREQANHCDLPICRLIKKIVGQSDIVCDLHISRYRIPTNEIIACYRGIYIASILREKKLRFEAGKKTGEDQGFIYKYMLYCQSFAFVPEAVYKYRINPGSAMFTANYSHFDAVDVLCDVVEYAMVHSSREIALQYKQDLIQFNALRTMEFAITTLLAAGESTRNIAAFMKNKGYWQWINQIIRQPEHYRSKFIALWKFSPAFCLAVYSCRKSTGRLMRKFGILR